jgi:hypothetical protein
MNSLWVFSTQNVDVSVVLEELLIIISNTVRDDINFKGAGVVNSLIEYFIVL